MQEKMLLSVSAGCNNDTVASFTDDDVVDGGAAADDECIFLRWLHRKRDSMDYGVMDDPASRV